jgi:hypothetical protein
MKLNNDTRFVKLIGVFMKKKNKYNVKNNCEVCRKTGLEKIWILSVLLSKVSE